MKVIVNVTAEHIKNGTKSNCRFCPIALAIKNLLKFPYSCTVEAASVSLNNGRYYPLPKEAQAFIVDFDEGLGVKPISFEMDITAEYVRVA